MEVTESIKNLATEYFDDVPELKGQIPPKLLVDFAIRKYKQARNFPKGYTEEQGGSDLEENKSIIAMAVVDLYLKTGAFGETSHSENSTTRSWENAYISSSIYSDVLPYVHAL